VVLFIIVLPAPTNYYKLLLLKTLNFFGIIIILILFGLGEHEKAKINKVINNMVYSDFNVRPSYESALHLNF
jgi:hypothetical protein